MNRLPELNSFMANENVIPQNELEKQLADWDFSNLILLFRIAGFDRLDDLKIISNDEFNILFPNVSQQALKCRVRAKIVEWRTRNGFSTNDIKPSTSATSCTSESPSIDSSPSEWVANQQSQANYALEEFLVSKKGSRIKEYYFQSDPPRFTTKTRDLFIESFVDFIHTNNMMLKPENFRKLSEEIGKAFPGESPELYYIGGRVPRGKLYNKYKNSRQKLKSYRCTSPETIAPSSSTNIVPTEYTADAEYTKLKKMLYSYKGHWCSEQNSYWEMTHLGRMAEIKKSKSNNFTEYLDEWPVLRKSFGSQLVEIDFEKLYPGKKYNLITNWDNFVTKILAYTNKNYKEPKFKSILKNISEEKEAKAIDIFVLLNAILKPTAKFKDNITFKLWKPTSTESVSSVYVDIDDIKSLKLIVEEKRVHYEAYNSILKPFIVGYNNDKNKKSFSVIVGNETYYSHEDFINCLDVTFKLFFVFNMEFPIESKRVWFFIQKYFFDLTSEFDWIDGDVQLLINELNR